MFGLNTSTAKLNVRPSPGPNAPPPTMWRPPSSPLSFVIVTTAEYSHASPPLGWRIEPSTRSGVMVGATASPPETLRCLRHDGQTLELWEIPARQGGPVRVAPAVVRAAMLTRPGDSPA